MASNRESGAAKKARDLYKRNEELFAYVYKIKKMDDAFANCRRIIQEYLKWKGYKLASPNQRTYKSKVYAKWYPKQIEKYIYINDTPNYWPTRETFVFDVELDEKEIELYLILNNYAGDRYYSRKKLHDILSELDGKTKRLTKAVTYRREVYKFDIYQSDEEIRRRFQEIFAKYKQNLYEVLVHLGKNNDELLQMKADAEAKRDKNKPKKRKKKSDNGKI